MVLSNNRIRPIRESKKLSGTKVAQMLNISPQYYYDIEKGERKLSAEIAAKLAAIFDVSLDELIGRKHISGLFEKILSDNPDILDKYTNEEQEEKPPSVQDIPKDINIAYLGGVKYELDEDVARRLKEDIELFKRLKAARAAEKEKYKDK